MSLTVCSKIGSSQLLALKSVSQAQGRTCSESLDDNFKEVLPSQDMKDRSYAKKQYKNIFESYKTADEGTT